MASFKAFLFSVLWIFSFQNDVPYAAVERAFNSQNASELVALGKEKILLSITGKEGAYSHQQAVMVLKDFFSKYPNGNFEYTFKGKNSADGSFAIGRFVNKTEEFRVTVHFKKLSTVFKIERITIEKS